MKDIELDLFDARTHWYPVATSDEVGEGRIVQSFLDGQELALWRSADGEAHVWENRCPHRGTRFTLGRIIDDTLSCAYHGWRFWKDAACTFIPANPNLAPPKSACAKAYAVHEEGGLIWATLGDTPWTGISGVEAPNAYCRSFVVYRSPDATRACLWNYFGAARVTGAGAVMARRTEAGMREVLYMQPMGAERTIVYLWLDSKDEAGTTAQSAATLSAARAFKALRTRLEAEVPSTPDGRAR